MRTSRMMSVSAGIDGPFPNEVASASSERATRLFTHASLFSALILQKFGIVSGSSYMAFCLPVYLVSLALMIFFGFCRIRLSCMILFGLMILTSLISTLVALSADSFSIQLSITSYLLFLILYCLFMFEPTYKFRCDIARKIFLKYALFISVVGILQYVLQFGHFQFRSFSVLFPFLKPILLEDFFNSNAIVQYGSDVTRANGVFLKEPSTFSQLIVIAATVEFMSTRRLHNLAVYGVAYLITLSGTGFISLTAALLIYAILSPKLAISLPVIGIAFLCAYFLVGLVVPDIVQTMEGRIYAVRQPGKQRLCALHRAVPQLVALLGRLAILRRIRAGLLFSVERGLDEFGGNQSSPKIRVGIRRSDSHAHFYLCHSRHLVAKRGFCFDSRTLRVPAWRRHRA